MRIQDERIRIDEQRDLHPNARSRIHANGAFAELSHKLEDACLHRQLQDVVLVETEDLLVHVFRQLTEFIVFEDVTDSRVVLWFRRHRHSEVLGYLR